MEHAPRPDGFDDALSEEIAHGAGRSRIPELLAADAATRIEGTDRFLRNILDRMADHDFRRPDRSFVESARELLNRLSGYQDDIVPELDGLVALILLNASLLERRFSAPDPRRQREVDDACADLFRRTSIATALREIYEPRDESAVATAQWRELDFDSLAYHRAGTTSFIVTGTRRSPDDESGAFHKLAVKCVLFPWNKLAAIANATDNYAQRYGGANTNNEVVVQPIASTRRWIIMPFVDGQTLGEHLVEFEQWPDLNPGVRMEKARDIARRLTSALHLLADGQPVVDGRPQHQHLDLSPSNVILKEGSRHLMLIDLGRNHLYSRQIGIVEHDDSVYIAPEVKNGADHTRGADFYSIGIILIQVLAGYAPRDGRTPNAVWEASPLLGALLDDLIEERPERRRLLQSVDRRWSFDDLGVVIDATFERALDDPAASRSGSARTFALLAPASREVSSQFKQWRHSRRRNNVLDASDSYLLLFSVLATAVWWFIAAKTALLKLDDLLTFEADTPPTGDELAANIIAFSQGLIAAKYYQTILARLQVRQLGGVLAWTTEIFMRFMSVVAVPTTLLAVFWKPSLWAWSCAAGAVGVALANLLTLLLASRILTAAEGKLSSTPPSAAVSTRGYEQWWWTMLLYAVVIAVIALGLQAGTLQDTGAYVFGLCLITFGIHYTAKLVMAGPAIRGELARAYSIGERLEILRTEQHVDIPDWPPHVLPTSWRRRFAGQRAHRRADRAPSSPQRRSAPQPGR